MVIPVLNHPAILQRKQTGHLLQINADINQLVNRFNNLNHDAAQQSIAQTSPILGKPSILRWYRDCQLTRTIKKRTTSVADKIELQRDTAIVR